MHANRRFPGHARCKPYCILSAKHVVGMYAWMHVFVYPLLFFEVCRVCRIRRRVESMECATGLVTGGRNVLDVVRHRSHI